jgi:hypothetical protein
VKNAKFFLKIHHDFTLKKDLSDLYSSIGHFYVELTDALLNTSKLLGKNPAEEVLITALNSGEIREENERLDSSKKYMENKKDITLTTKVIPLTGEQYSRALIFASSKEGGIYAAGVDDCIRFTQEVYSVAGLPRHFTDVYTAKELLSFGSAASKAALLRYGSGDSLLSVQGASLEEVANKYNVPVDRVLEGQRDMFLERNAAQKQFVILSDKVWKNISGLKSLAGAEDEVSSLPEDVYTPEWAHNLMADSLKVVNAAFAVSEGKIPGSEFQSELSREVDRTNPDFVHQTKEAEETLDWIKELTRSTNALFGEDVAKGQVEVDTKPSVKKAKSSTVNVDAVQADEFDDILESACSDVFDVEEVSRAGTSFKPTSNVFEQLMRQQVESCREAMSSNPFLSAAAGLDNESFNQSYQDVMDILGVPIFPQVNH